MTWVEFRDLSPQQRAILLPERPEKLKQAIAKRVREFRKMVRNEGIRLDQVVCEVHPADCPPPDAVIDTGEIKDIAEGLIALRKNPTAAWSRAIFLNAYEHEPQTTGERLLMLMRKYWLLTFGYTGRSPSGRKEIEVPGIAQIIFQSNKAIDALDRALVFGNFKDMSQAQAAASIRSRLPLNQRNLSKLKERLKQRVRRWGKN